MKTFNAVLVGMLCLILASSASATLVGTVSGGPVTMNAGNSAGGPVAIGVDSDTSSSIEGFNVGLALVPQSGATGTLSFNLPTLGAAFGGNYFFAADQDTDAGDVASSAGLVSGVAVDALTDPVLLSVSFSASAGASGVWNLYLVQGSNILGPESVTSFTNAFNVNIAPPYTSPSSPFGIMGAALTTITVSAVPEPSSFLAVGLVLSLGSAGWFVRRRRAAAEVA